MEEHDSFDIRSKAFQEVIGEPPSWLLKWGITAITVAFIALFVVGYLLEYPETITAPIQLETSDPPVEMAAPTLGTLKPYYSENDSIQSGTVLARIKNLNSGNPEHIHALDTILQLHAKGIIRVPEFSIINQWDLGLIEGEYLRFFQAFTGSGTNSSIQNQTISSINESINIYKEDIIELRKIIAGKQQRLDNIPEEIEKLQAAYSKSKASKDQLNLISIAEDRTRLQEEIKFHKQQISDKERQIISKENEISLFRQEIQGKQLTRQQNIAFEASRLRSKIDEWKINHIIKAPISGTLVFQDKLKANSEEFTVDRGEKIFAIIPKNAQDSLVGKLFLSSEESIKVEVGRDVKIKISAFKPSEYGLIEGTVIDKATLPVNGQYLVRVNLPDKMKTTKNKIIPFEHQMQGEAQIITEDRRFTGIIFDQFMAMLRR